MVDQLAPRVVRFVRERTALARAGVGRPAMLLRSGLSSMRHGWLMLVISVWLSECGDFEPAPPGPQAAAAGEQVRLALLINGRTHSLLVEPRWTLLFVRRERLGLTGTKLGCERLVEHQQLGSGSGLRLPADGHLRKLTGKAVAEGEGGIRCERHTIEDTNRVAAELFGSQATSSSNRLSRSSSRIAGGSLGCRGGLDR